MGYVLFAVGAFSVICGVSGLVMYKGSNLIYGSLFALGFLLLFFYPYEV